MICLDQDEIETWCEGIGATCEAIGAAPKEPANGECRDYQQTCHPKRWTTDKTFFLSLFQQSATTHLEMPLLPLAFFANVPSQIKRTGLATKMEE